MAEESPLVFIPLSFFPLPIPGSSGWTRGIHPVESERRPGLFLKLLDARNLPRNQRRKGRMMDGRMRLSNPPQDHSALYNSVSRFEKSAEQTAVLVLVLVC
jgi:hypothetical protein